MKFIIENEGNTVGCLLRNVLQENGATFFACNVKHPQDTFLQITVEGDNPTEILMDSIFEVEQKISKLLDEINKSHIQAS